MPTLNIKLTDSANPAVMRMITELRGKGLISEAAGAVRIEVREHFAMLERTRANKNNWPRQHFYMDVRKTVTATISYPTTATVSITHVAIRQRLEGGYIFPTAGKKYLTIPARPEAYGKRAREIPGLKFGFAVNKYGNLAPALVQTAAQDVKFGRARKDGTHKVTAGAYGDAFYFLVKKVFQPADRSMLPTDVELFAAAERGAVEYATAMADRANKGGAS